MDTAAIATKSGGCMSDLVGMREDETRPTVRRLRWWSRLSVRASLESAIGAALLLYGIVRLTISEALPHEHE